MNTRTRHDSRRGRSAAREAERTARRDRFRLFLARADCAALCADIEAEVAENDTHRRSAAGQQAAVTRLHVRIAAAEQAIVEAEVELDHQAERLATAAKLACALGDYLPGDGWELAECIRRLCEGDITPGQAFAETAH